MLLIILIFSFLFFLYQDHFLPKIKYFYFTKLLRNYFMYLMMVCLLHSAINLHHLWYLFIIILLIFIKSLITPYLWILLLHYLLIFFIFYLFFNLILFHLLLKLKNNLQSLNFHLNQKSLDFLYLLIEEDK